MIWCPACESFYDPADPSDECPFTECVACEGARFWPVEALDVPLPEEHEHEAWPFSVDEWDPHCSYRL